MGFTNQERINLNSKVLSASVIDGNEAAQWYEARFLNEFILPPNKILLDFAVVRQYPANSLAVAQANAAGPLAGIIEDLSDDGYAVQLTALPGAAGTYVALETYGDFSSSKLDNWIQPQAIPQTSSAPSIGYAVALYDGQPGSGGTLISVTSGETGSGDTKSVGWVWNYSLGVLILSADFRGTISDPWIKGFRYIGDTVDSLPRDGYTAVQEIFTGADGYDYVLQNQPDPNTLMLWHSGFKIDPSDYTVSGNTVTYLDASGSESVHIFYFTSSNGTITVIPVGGSGGGGFTDEQVTTSTATITTPSTGVSHVVEVETTTIGAASTITLPASPNQCEIIVKDSAGDAALYNITVSGNGNLIDGQSSVTINVDDDFVVLRYTSSGAWRMVG